MRYQIRHAWVKYAAETILEDINFEIRDKEKIAVVGRNGCGKTTFLKLICGDVEMANPDSDESCGISMAGYQSIGYLRQISFPDGSLSAGEEIKKVFAPVFEAEKELLALAERMTREQTPEIMHRYDALQAKMTALGGYTWKQDMETMFQRFGFALSDLERPIGEFSGGQQTKIAFIKLLLSRPDIMLLDEPTNHMDIIGKEALETMLQNYTGTVLYVSHDRYFVRKTATAILDFETDQTVWYPCGYDDFLWEKQKREARSGDGANGRKAAESGRSGAGKTGGAAAGGGRAGTGSKTAADVGTGKAAGTGRQGHTPTLDDVFDKKTYYNPGKIASRRRQQIEKYERQLKESEERLQELTMKQMDPALATDYVKLEEISAAARKEEELQENLLNWLIELEVEEDGAG